MAPLRQGRMFAGYSRGARRAGLQDGVEPLRRRRAALFSRCSSSGTWSHPLFAAVALHALSGLGPCGDLGSLTLISASELPFVKGGVMSIIFRTKLRATRRSLKCIFTASLHPLRGSDHAPPGVPDIAIEHPGVSGLPQDTRPMGCVELDEATDPVLAHDALWSGGPRFVGRQYDRLLIPESARAAMGARLKRPFLASARPPGSPIPSAAPADRSFAAVGITELPLTDEMAAHRYSRAAAPAKALRALRPGGAAAGGRVVLASSPACRVNSDARRRSLLERAVSRRAEDNTARPGAACRKSAALREDPGGRRLQRMADEPSR